MQVVRIKPSPIFALQFKANGSEPWPAEVFTYNGVPFVSLSDGVEVPISDGEWLVSENGALSIYGPASFEATFQEAEVQDVVLQEVVETPSEVIDDPMPDVIEIVPPVVVEGEQEKVSE